MKTPTTAALISHLREWLIHTHPHSSTDAELIRRFAEDRDESAFAALVDRHGPMVLGVARRVAGDHHLAEDVFQATFLALARHANRFRRPAALPAWLHHTACNIAVSALRDRNRRERAEAAASRPVSRAPLDEISSRELLAILDEELRRLPERFRLPVILCCLEGRSQEEAAALLGWTPGSVKGRLERGRRRLRQCLARRGLTFAVGAGVPLLVAPPAIAAGLRDVALHAAREGESASALVAALAETAPQPLCGSSWKPILVFAAIGLVGLGLGLAAPWMSRGKTAFPVAASSVVVAEVAGPPPAEREVEDEAVVIGKVVDTAGKPVAGATVTALGNPRSRPVESGADGAFRLPLGFSADDGIFADLFVRGPTGDLGYKDVWQKKPEPVRVVLKPPHALTVQVTAQDGKPVTGAEVSFRVGMRLLVSGRTDSKGRWIARVPVDARGWEVLARKAKVGFDYAMPKGPSSDRAKLVPVPDQVRLTLDGAWTLRVKLVDRKGNPVPGVKVGPWTVHKRGHEEYVNLSGAVDLWPTTGKEGVALFDWLPRRMATGISMEISCEDYYMSENVAINANRPADELTLTLLPMEQLSGRITHPDGRPAAGIRLRAAGAGISLWGCEQSTRTGADGRYTMKVRSQHDYIVAVSDKRFGAPYRAPVVVRPGEPVAGVDFVLGQVTRLHGRVTLGKDHRPAEEISLRAHTEEQKVPPELWKEGDWHPERVHMSIEAQTDKTGTYELYLGPGKYTLHGPVRTKPVPLVIPAEKPPGEIVHNFWMARPERGPLAGRVVDAGGRPVSGATVSGVYTTEARGKFENVKTGKDGRFDVERFLEPLVLHVVSTDGKLAGVTRIEAEAAKVDIRVGPVASATGRLLGSKGKALAEKKLCYSIHVAYDDPEYGPYMEAFEETAVTDKQGRFTLKGLVPGQTYVVAARFGGTVTKVTPKKAGTMELGDVRVDP